MKVSEIMDKNPPTVLPTSTIKEVAEVLLEHRLNAVPVTDEEGNLLGIVSEGDLLYKKVRPQAPHYMNLLGASIFYGGLRKYNDNFHKLLAAQTVELMTKDVVVCHEDEAVEDAASVMLEEHLKILPVVKDNKVVGCVSRRNIISIIAKES